jgi:hypothetical protein
VDVDVAVAGVGHEGLSQGSSDNSKVKKLRRRQNVSCCVGCGGSGGGQ